MSMNEVVEKIKSTFPKYEKLDHIIEQLNGKQFHSYGNAAAWVNDFSDEDKEIFDIEIATSLAAVCESGAENAGDLICLIEVIYAVDHINDKEWAKRLVDKAKNLANERDLIVLAKLVADEDCLNDKVLALEIVKGISPSDYYGGMDLAGFFQSIDDVDSAEKIFKESLVLANDVISLLQICEMYLNGKDYFQSRDFSFLTLNDDSLAREYIKKAIAVSENSIDLQQIGTIVGREENKFGKDRGLNDKEWAKELLKKSYEMEKNDRENNCWRLQILAEILIDNTIINLDESNDALWINEIYKKALDLGDAAEKKDLKKSMKERNVKLKK